MKYNPKMNIRHFEREIADRFKSKYEDKVCWTIIALTIFISNFMVWWFNGFVAEMIISIPLSALCSLPITMVLASIIKWCYCKIHIKLFAKFKSVYDDKENLEKFISHCRIKND
jgi:hypothetical protein